jgi:hypothetical protein
MRGMPPGTATIRPRLRSLVASHYSDANAPKAEKGNLWFKCEILSNRVRGRGRVRRFLSLPRKELETAVY